MSCLSSPSPRLRSRLVALVLSAISQTASPNTPTSDFTDNGNGTVTHHLTGLTWMRCSIGQLWSGATCTGAGTGYSWEQAFALRSEFGGHSDWRLPTPYELASIVHHENSDIIPAINREIFPGSSPSASYWSSTLTNRTIDGFPLAVGVSFRDGATAQFRTYSPILVRLVRGVPLASGLTTPTSDFVDNGNGTVTHNRTRLTWKKCVEGQTWNGTTCTGSAFRNTYRDAAQRRSNFAGFSDWRLPSISELASIVEFSSPTAWSNPSLFPNTPRLDFFVSNMLSSTEYRGQVVYWWSLSLLDGDLEPVFANSNIGVVRLVRGEQAAAKTKIDCIFAWGELNWPQYFPGRKTSQQWDVYYYRHYPETRNYLALSWADQSIWILGTASGDVLTRVGALSSFEKLSGC